MVENEAIAPPALGLVQRPIRCLEDDRLRRAFSARFECDADADRHDAGPVRALRMNDGEALDATCDGAIEVLVSLGKTLGAALV